MSGVSRVVVDCVCRCPFSVAHDYAEDFFKAAAQAGAALHVPLRDVIPSVRYARLRQPVRMFFNRRLDSADTGRVRDAVDVNWTAHTRLFPRFNGVLRFGIESVDETRLTLEATYVPPLGFFGVLFDAVIGRRIARAALRDFLRELRIAMERREEDFRRTAPGG